MMYLVPTYRVAAIKLRNPLVPKLQLGNPDGEAPASRDRKLELPVPNSQAGAWELALLMVAMYCYLLLHTAQPDDTVFPPSAWERGRG